MFLAVCIFFLKVSLRPLSVWQRLKVWMVTQAGMCARRLPGERRAGLCDSGERMNCFAVHGTVASKEDMC